MTEVLRVTFLVLVAGALGTIVAYLALFVAAAVWTLRAAGRPDPLTTELEDLLAEELDLLLSEVQTPGPPVLGDR